MNFKVFENRGKLYRLVLKWARISFICTIIIFTASLAPDLKSVLRQGIVKYFATFFPISFLVSFIYIVTREELYRNKPKHVGYLTVDHTKMIVNYIKGEGIITELGKKFLLLQYEGYKDKTNYGTLNYLHVPDKDSVRIIPFSLCSEREKEELKQWLGLLYENGVNVYEQVEHKRGFLLGTNLTKEQIAGIESRYNIDWNENVNWGKNY